MAWARSFKTGSSATKAVLLAIANYADEEGIAWPSQEQLADDTELSRHTIMRAMDSLEELGLLNRERRHRGDGSRTSDLIMLDLSCTVLRSKVQCSKVHQPKSQGATAEPIIEPSLNRIRRAKPSKDADEKAAVDEWNAVAADLGLPSVQKMTAARRQKLAARLRDCGGLDGWRAAMAKIRGSPLCRGEVGTWSADFDFVLQESKFVKLMEGKYDGRANEQRSKATGNSRATNENYLDAIVREAERREAEGGGGSIQDIDARAA
jgi:DNA-binding transcriptional regulator YhcF (GntR family)